MHQLNLGIRVGFPHVLLELTGIFLAGFAAHMAVRSVVAVVVR